MKVSFLPKYWKEYLFHPAVFYLLLAIGLVPSFFIFFRYSVKNTQLESYSQKLQLLQKRSRLFIHKKQKEDLLLSQMNGADPYYLDKYVESLSFLDSEIKKWQRLSADKPIEAIEKRLNFLCSDKNRLFFAEGEIIQEGSFKEVEEIQKHPVEVNEDDLKRILCAIEGVKIAPYTSPDKHPQILIKQFDLTKKTHPEIKEKVFVLSMHLLKRELLSEPSR